MPWSTGSKAVSLRLSKPVANLIWGTVQDPKSPMSAVEAVEEAVAAVAEAVATVEAESLAPAVTVAMTVTVAWWEGLYMKIWHACNNEM